LLAAAINRPLAKLAAATVLGQQRGFIRGRGLADNLIEIEELMLKAGQFYATHYGTILVDIKAAFPSLSHKWLFTVLRKMDVPARLRVALRELYNNCQSLILFGGSAAEHIKIAAGIKQGCPASGSLFVLAMDPFVRYLCLRLPRPLYSVVAFADDIAIGCMWVLRSLALVFQAFDIFARATALKINVKKTTIIPYWERGVFDVRRFVVGHVPSLSQVEVMDYGTLLGLAIGPSAFEHVAECQLAKLWQRTLEARAGNAGMFAALRHYKVHAFPTMSHILQFVGPPPEVLKCESRCLQLLARGPWNTFPGTSMQHLCELGCTTEAPSLQLVGRAAAFRTAVRSNAFYRARERLAAAADEDDALLLPRVAPWMKQSLLNTTASSSLASRVTSTRSRSRRYKSGRRRCCCLVAASVGSLSYYIGSSGGTLA
jgi:hypothetical protein